MSDYRLIAIDMDGTLLDSRKKILPETVSDMKAAVMSGKYVTLCTGRSMLEIVDYEEILPFVSFGVLISGAQIYDLKEKKTLFWQAFEPVAAERIITVAERLDGMIHLMTADESIVREDQVGHLDDFQMGIYQELYDRTSTITADIRKAMAETGMPLKMLIHFRSVADRTAGYEMLKDLPLEFAEAETTSLEMSPPGITKGAGLLRLAEHLRIPVEEMIAVGDAPNDTQMLKVAGLPIAMENAEPEIMALCDEVVADNDHNGVGQAIRQFLL